MATLAQKSTSTTINVTVSRNSQMSLMGADAAGVTVGTNVITVEFGYNAHLTFLPPAGYEWADVAIVQGPGSIGGPFCVAQVGTAQAGATMYQDQKNGVTIILQEIETSKFTIANSNQNTTLSNGAIVGLRLTVKDPGGILVTSQDPQIKDKMGP